MSCFRHPIVVFGLLCPLFDSGPRQFPTKKVKISTKTKEKSKNKFLRSSVNRKLSFKICAKLEEKIDFISDYCRCKK